MSPSAMAGNGIVVIRVAAMRTGSIVEAMFDALGLSSVFDRDSVL